MKKIWSHARSYLLVFALIFVVSLVLNLNSSGEFLCVTKTWCPDRGEAAIVLALLFTLPFLIVTAFFLHLVPYLTSWIFDHPQHGLAIPFFFMAVIPLVPLWIYPEAIPELKKNLSYAAILTNLVFAFLSLAYAGTISKGERWVKEKQNRLVATLLLIGLVFCTSLTVAAVAKW